MLQRRALALTIFVGFILTIFTAADILVNIPVNKPTYDISEAFVSFSIPPELLYETLDGPDKKTLTHMAALLGPSYLKLTGDFFFPMEIETSLKKPTQSIWSGFNRWTQAINWTMVIPVKYTPLTWDPIDALRMLNISNAVGIEKCIWQLGLDFGAARANDYTADLYTLDTMVDTFRPYVKSWKIMGADVTSGSSAEETKRYIEMTKDLNAAFGWTQPAGYQVEATSTNYIFDKDPSLKVMMAKKVPIWMSLPIVNPASRMANMNMNLETAEAIRWAHTLGDAASSGLDVIFKPITKNDITTPDYAFYVTVLFKKLMGNRVFAPKLVKRGVYSTKIYAHCSNGISGGIALMGVNTDENPAKISAKLSARFTGSEVWQFILTAKNGEIYLNNDRVTLNTTFEPLVKIKHPNRPLNIVLPPASISFWVLPLANHEDCQFTELLMAYSPENQWEARQRKQTSTDRLLKKLILETSFTDQMRNRRRRSISSAIEDKTSETNSNLRQRRFILQDAPSAKQAASKPVKRSNVRQVKKAEEPQHWLAALLKPKNLPPPDFGLKRHRRSIDFFTSLLTKNNNTPSKNGQRRKSSPKPTPKPVHPENIFKTQSTQEELELPDGDVHFQLMGDANGDASARTDTQAYRSPSRFSSRELPTEYFEIIPRNMYTDPSNRERSTSRKYDTNKSKEDYENIYSQIARTPVKEHQRESLEDSEKLRNVFGSELYLHGYHRIDRHKLKEYLSESEEKQKEIEPQSNEFDSLARWSATRREKRSISTSNDPNSWQTNLIPTDDSILQLPSPDLDEHLRSTTENSIIKTRTKLSSAEKIKNHVSEIFDSVKNHIDSFFKSFWTPNSQKASSS